MESIIHFHGNIPIIMSEHNAFDRQLGFGHYIQRFIKSRSFSKVCVLTPFDQGYANAKGLRNVVVMPNPNTFKCLTDVEYDKLFLNRNNILACGRLDIWHVKGFDLAIQAFSKVAELNPNVDLDIVGDNSEKSVQILSQMANSYGIKDRVHFLGRRTDVDELMRTHKVFVLSSRTEGFPMVITEAMSQGLPCVAFERLAASIINDSIDGMLVNNEDVVEMSEAIAGLLINEKQRYQIGLNAVKNVNRFSVERMANRWEKMFLQLIHDNRK